MSINLRPRGSPEWRPVVGYEGSYEVSEDGRVRSIRKVDGKGRPTPPRERKTPVSGNGYPTITLWERGKGATRTVHSLVAEAFLGPRPEGQEVLHLDGTRTNNCITNLKYGSRSENLRQAVQDGTNWQTRKTECPRGHPYTARNTKYKDSSRKHRTCRACAQERTDASHHQRPFDPAKADEIYQNHLEKEKKNGNHQHP